MIIYLAESGTEIHLEEGIERNFSLLQKELEYLVPIHAQLLMSANGVPWREVSDTWREGSDNIPGAGPIFLFNRLVLANQQNITQMSIDIEAPVPSSTVAQILLPEGNANVLERTESFVITFNSHVKYGKALLEIAKKHLATCERLYQEQTVQTKALGIAINNLDTHARSTFESFNAFNTHAQKELTKHSSLLSSCPTDLNTLAKIPIHPAIAVDKRLDDFVPKDKLFAWANRCQASHDHLVGKAAQLLESIHEIKSGCDIEALKITGVDFPKLQKLLESTREVVGKVEEIQSFFLRDFERVKGSFEEVRMNPIDADGKLQAIEVLYGIHSQEYIPEVTKIDRYVRETVIYFSDSKLHLTQILHAKLHAITHYQSMIASVAPTISSLVNAVNMQSEAFLQLLHVHRMAPAWGATLVEIVRRREYVRIFLQKAKDMADVLNQFRAHEQKRRDTFTNEILRYIPHGLISGLDEPPPYCEISVSNTKDSLPNIRPEDIMTFEKMVSTIRTSQIAGDPNTASDAISKLQATMLKMAPQVENVQLEFDKIIAKSNLKIVHEESKRKSGSSKVFPSPSQSDQTRVAAEMSGSIYAKQEDTIKAYESRIKTLEKLLQDQYHAKGEVADKTEVDQLRQSLAEEKKTSESQKLQIQELLRENEKLRLEKGAAENGAKTLLKTNQEIIKQTQLNKQLLIEISLHLHSCLTSLRTNEDSISLFDTTEKSVHADNLRQLMRKVEDDIISQMALLSNYKLNESVGNNSEEAQSVAHEMVILMQRIGDLENHLKDIEAELTESQAKEAVSEAELLSAKKLLSKTTESLLRYQEQISLLKKELEGEKTASLRLKQEVQSTHSKIGTLESKISSLEVQTIQKSTTPLTSDEANALLLHTKDAQLRVSKEVMEDWAIISRLSLNTLAKNYADWIELQQLMGIVPLNVDVSCQDILNIDPERISDDIEQFLPSITTLAKQTYEKVMIMSLLSSSSIVSAVKMRFQQMKTDISKRIAFERFQIASLCLFIPTKNPLAWAAFHVNSPHYFLAIDSHPAFEARAKKREWILAYITDMTRCVAGQEGDSNKFGLGNGVVYYLCSGTPWN